MLRARPSATPCGKTLHQVARKKLKINRNPKREPAAAAGAMPLKGSLAAILTLLKLPWISSQSVHRNGSTPYVRMKPEEADSENVSRK
jgi:hypothetical protein